jgi:predicted Zn-dependent protease
VQELTINGFPAATATAAGEQWSFRLYVVRFGSEIYRFIYATKNRSDATDRAFRASIETFRRLSLTEIRTARPLRVKVITVKNGDTIESLAAHMNHVEQPVARFRVLNGLTHTARLKAGDQVKILIE